VIIRRKWQIIAVVTVILLGVLAGILTGGNILLSKASVSRYAEVEKVISEKTETMVVEHSHDGLPMHKHVITITTTTLGTTPDDTLEDLPALNIPTSATLKPAQTTSNVAQSVANPAQTTATTPKAYQVWLYYNDIIPPGITIPLGATVTWTNMDNMEHSITFANGLVDRRLVTRGTTGNYTFTEIGTFGYHCTLHPFSAGEVGEVIVK